MSELTLMSPDLMNDAVDVLDEKGRWRARDVAYHAGRWDQLKSLLPTFEFAGFAVADDAPVNPYLRTVVRRPRTRLERPIPVATVSNNYPLAQHIDVAERCLEGIRRTGLDPTQLRCELGLTELGEWMNLRVYFPEGRRPRLRNVDDVMDLRLECMNSVDGSSRLLVLFGWRRLVCTNGLVIPETVTELRDIHDRHLTLEPIADVVQRNVEKAARDVHTLQAWEARSVSTEQLMSWVDGLVLTAWGPTAACRVLHVCRTGWDVELIPPFRRVPPSAKQVEQVRVVPGAAIPAKNLFDVSQALSWVATSRSNPAERIEWQRQIPELVNELT